jgi:hypothetical protein
MSTILRIVAGHCRLSKTDLGEESHENWEVSNDTKVACQEKHVAWLQRSIYQEHKALAITNFLINIKQAAEEKGSLSSEILAYRQWVQLDSRTLADSENLSSSAGPDDEENTDKLRNSHVHLLYHTAHYRSSFFLRFQRHPCHPCSPSVARTSFYRYRRLRD